MSLEPPTGWVLLVLSLPSRSTAPRMRVWRALKGAGAAVLRDGVYLLPASQAAARVFEEQAGEVVRGGGAAQVLTVSGVDRSQEAYFRSLFDRSREYARILEQARSLKAAPRRRRLAATARALRRLRREYEAIRATDYFAGPAAEQAGEALSEAEVVSAARASPGEPQAQTGAIRRLDLKDYRGRTWATRERPWVDRLASAWLIKRFLDPKAKIVWLKDPRKCPKRALGFDFDGAAFTHIGSRVTFEVLLASFGLEQDQALARLGGLVHYLDVGGVPAPEGEGLKRLIEGARRAHADDDRLLAETIKTFDYLYNAFSAE